MKNRLTKCLLVLALALAAAAQTRMDYTIVTPDSGHVALGLALRRLSVSGTFLQAPAHPDDESNPLLAYFTRGLGLRAIDLQNNRGDGGQNEIGPELFRDMAVLRTGELLGAHRLDGAEQYFTRAIDFGYSFDPEEVIAKWGRKDMVDDYVRMIRTFRPDVIVTMNIQGRGGDRAHEANTILVHEAYLASGDPARFPEQLKQGLRPWQAKKLYFSAGFGGPVPPNAPPGFAPPAGVNLTAMDLTAADPLLGRTWAEIGADARTSHKCQGVGATLGGFGTRGLFYYQLTETTIPGQKDKKDASLFDGIDISLTSIAQYAGPNPPEALSAALAAILADARRAQAAFAAGNDAATAEPVEAGLTAVRALRARLASLGLNDSARYEIDFRLKQKERDYEDAVLAAHNLTFDALANDGLVVDGQPLRLNLSATNRGPSEVGVTAVDIAGFDAPGKCQPGPVRKNAAFACAAEAKIPKNAKPTTPYFHDNYWKHPENQAIQIFDPDVPFGVPFAPTPFRVVFHVHAGSVDVSKEVPVEYRYIKDVFTGDKRMELNVVPAFSVTVAPTLAVIAVGKPVEREIYVSVTNGTKGAAKAAVALELPAGWHADPASVPLAFAHEDESLSARFRVTAAAQSKTGEYTLRAVVTSASAPGEKFAEGYREIEYPHIERRQVVEPAAAALKVIDVKTVPGLNVGYIAGMGDQVPAAIEQLGARLSYIDANELAWGDLSRHDVIVTGVRAYEKRADLRAYNRRLLEYVERGGTLIVQYNKTGIDLADFAPYPAKIANSRVTDETAPVKVLAPGDPVFNFPNKIGPAAWANWVQERGLYYLGDKDGKYVDLVTMADPFKDNPGEKLGSLVEARVGKGRWIYLGLALWRQLPAGTDGAYQLMANLLALPKAPASRSGLPAGPPLAGLAGRH